VIFDCDGVLADSEPSSVSAWTRAIARFGLAVTSHEVESFIGQTEHDLALHYAPLVGTSVTAMEDAAREEFLALVGDLAAFTDGARLVEMVELAGIPFGVGSNSPRWRLAAVLGGIGLGPRLTVSVAGDEVPSPKPAPDVYVEVARRLGVDPEGCVVIEDTPTGLRAARAAGCSTIAVHRGAVPRDRLAEADRIVDSLDELIDGLAWAP
jgi:beta-phosphoglucomutase-like phosphatase (HAD superfamily)